MDVITLASIVILITFVGIGIWYRFWSDKQEKIEYQGNPYIQSVFQPQSDAGRFYREQRERAYRYAARHAREDNLGQIVATVIAAEMIENIISN